MPLSTEDLEAIEQRSKLADGYVSSIGKLAAEDGLTPQEELLVWAQSDREILIEEVKRLRAI